MVMKPGTWREPPTNGKSFFRLWRYPRPCKKRPASRIKASGAMPKGLCGSKTQNLCIYPVFREGCYLLPIKFPALLSIPQRVALGLTRSGLVGSSLESDGAAIIVGRVVVVDITVVVDIHKVRGITGCG